MNQDRAKLEAEFEAVKTRMRQRMDAGEELPLAMSVLEFNARLAIMQEDWVKKNPVAHKTLTAQELYNKK